MLKIQKKESKWPEVKILREIALNFKLDRYVLNIVITLNIRLSLQVCVSGNLLVRLATVVTC